MLFSPLWFWGLRREAEAACAGAVVRGGRLDDACFRLNLERGGAGLDLAFWVTPPYARIECLKSSRAGDLPAAWSVLSGAKVISVSQPDTDRRLLFEFASGELRLELDFFAFGKPALVLRQVGATGRPIVQIGMPPRGGKPSGAPFLLDLQELPSPGEDANDVSLVEWLQRAVRGVDRFWTEAALNAAGLTIDAAVSVENVAKASNVMRTWADKLHTAPPGAFVIHEDDEPIGVAQIDLGPWLPRFRFERAESLSMASSRLVYRHRKRDTSQDQRRDLLLRAAAQRKKLVRRRAALAEEREAQLDYRIWQENADWLTAHLSIVQQGDAELVVETSEGERTVALDPALRPARQADKWYQKARRLKRGMTATQRRLTDAEALLKQLEIALAEARACLSAQDDEADAAFARLRTLLGTKATTSTRDRQAPSLPFRRFRSPGGLAIWVGRNNKENDELTLHHAHKHDLWFHAQQTPGSHVVLRSHALKQAPPRADILAAAAVAAFYSKARNSKKVPVIYTEARYVRKPRNAPPGQVRVEREQSIMVEPERMPAWDDE